MYTYNETFQFENVEKNEVMQVSVDFFCGREDLIIVDYTIVDGDRDDDGNLIKVDWIDKEYILHELYAQGIYAEYK